MWIIVLLVVFGVSVLLMFSCDSFSELLVWILNREGWVNCRCVWLCVGLIMFSGWFMFSIWFIWYWLCCSCRWLFGVLVVMVWVRVFLFGVIWCRLLLFSVVVFSVFGYYVILIWLWVIGVRLCGVLVVMGFIGYCRLLVVCCRVILVVFILFGKLIEMVGFCMLVLKVMFDRLFWLCSRGCLLFLMNRLVVMWLLIGIVLCLLFSLVFRNSWCILMKLLCLIIVLVICL